MKIGIWLAILSGAFYGTLGLFGVYLLQEGFGLSDFLFWRFLLSVVILLPFLNSKQHWKDIFSKPGSIIIGVSSVFYASATSFYFYAIEYIGSGLAMVLFYCYPIFVVLLDWLHGKNPPSKVILKGLAIVLLGTLFLSDPSNWHLSLDGIGWGLLCAFGFGVYFYTSQQAIKGLSVVSGTFCICMGNFLIFALLIGYKGQLHLPTTAWAIGNITGLAVLSTVLPIYLVFVALRTIDGTKASILSVFEPIVTIILGVMFLHEKITISQYIGVIIILGGVYIVQSCKDGAKNLVTDPA
jgi:drug/metabolite transporter (DMT)-like permease